MQDKLDLYCLIHHSTDQEHLSGLSCSLFALTVSIINAVHQFRTCVVSFDVDKAEKVLAINHILVTLPPPKKTQNDLK